MTATQRFEIIQAWAFGAFGLLGVGYGVYELVLQRPLAYEFSLALVMLVMAYQFAAGVSKEARLWVERVFFLVLTGTFLPEIVKTVVENAITRSILAATALVVLVLAAGWLLGRSRRRSSPS